MVKKLTLSSIKKNPNILYSNIQWLKQMFLQSSEIYKNLVLKIEKNPNEFKIKKLLSIMNYNKRLGDIMTKNIMETMDISSKVSKITFAEINGGESTSTDEILKVLFPQKLDEIAQMDDMGKTELMIAGLTELEAKAKLMISLGTIQEEAKGVLANEKKLFSKEIIDKILASDLVLNDKKMFLDNKIESIKDNLESLGVFIGEAKAMANNYKDMLLTEIKQGEETTNTFDKLTNLDTGLQATEDKSSEIINEQLTLLHLLLQKREQLEQQA